MALHVTLAAGSYVFGKHAAVAFESAAALTQARALIASVPFLLLTGWVLPRPRFTAKEWLEIGALGALLVSANQFPFLMGMRTTAPAHPALIYALTPVGVLVMSTWLGRTRSNVRQWFGVALALAGVLVLLEPWRQGEAFREVRTGDAWVCLAVASWIVYCVATRDVFRKHGAPLVTAWSLILGAIVFLPFGLPPLLAMDVGALPTSAWVSLLYLALGTSVAMMWLWNYLLAHLQPVEVAICANLQPPATAALSALLASFGMLPGDPHVSALYWIGTAAVLGGVFTTQARLFRRSVPALPAVESSPSRRT